METQQLLEALWQNYTQINPQAKHIHESLISLGEKQLLNDHIAFRTYNHSSVNIEVLASHFVELGWQSSGEYEFKQKKLKAQHFEHQEDSSLPKIFISELLTEQFSETVREMVEGELVGISGDVFQDVSLLTSGRLQQGLPNYELYSELLEESEYAAWMYVFGFRPNHFTINVNALEHFEHLSELNEYIEGLGYSLNDSGGTIKGGEDEGLAQSSTLAAKVGVEFDDGETRLIPGCYYEFAERFVLGDGQLFQGFVTGSADKIFESTDTNKS